MPKVTQWEGAIGRRIRLRDLYVFLTVLECRSMSQAALRLGVSTPSVSELVAGLEHAVGARLLDRSYRGVAPTLFGEALQARGLAAFDELRQGIRDIESIADPGRGEVRIGCPESTAAFLVPVIEHVAKRHPRIRFVTRQVHAPTVEYPELLDREVDLVLARLVEAPIAGKLGDQFNAEVLMDDPFSAVVGAKSKWARRRKIDLAELAQARWVLPSLDVLAGLMLTDAFRARGLEPPEPHITTFSILLRNNLASRGDYISVLPRSVLRLGAARYGLKELPVPLSSARRSPLAIVTLRNRSLTPSVRVFIEAARQVAKEASETGNAPARARSRGERGG
jgi:DNA-binding transcriptional LysR family regulator